MRLVHLIMEHSPSTDAAAAHADFQVRGMSSRVVVLDLSWLMFVFSAVLFDFSNLIRR